MRAIPVGYGRSKLGVWGAIARQQSVEAEYTGSKIAIYSAAKSDLFVPLLVTIFS